MFVASEEGAGAAQWLARKAVQARAREARAASVNTRPNILEGLLGNEFIGVLQIELRNSPVGDGFGGALLGV